MALLYGSAVSSTGDAIRQSTRSFAHARERVTLSTYDGTPTDSDDLIIGLFKSNDRIVDIEHFTDGAASAGAFNIGIWEVDVRNQDLSITVVDADLFSSALASTTSLTFNNRISVFSEAGTVDDIMDRGKSLWELAALGAASYTEDPGKDFALVAECSTTFDAATELGWRVVHVDGD